MSRYTDDPRVAVDEDRYIVSVGGADYVIEHDKHFAWMIVPTDAGIPDNWMSGYADADDAIDVLLFKPALTVA